MSEDDPDLVLRGWSHTDNAVAAALRPPLPPDFPKALPALIECSDAERAQVQAWELDSVQAMHAWCQERLAVLMASARLRSSFSLSGG